MQNEFLSITIAFFGGFLPSIVWLIFWNEEKRNPEPKKMIILAFLGGVAAVFLSLFLEKIAFTSDPNTIFRGQFLQSVLAWFKGIASQNGTSVNQILLICVFAPVIEEILKFAMAYFLVLRTRDDNEPIDPVIYLITTALGFAAVENMLFIAQTFGDATVQNHLVMSVFTGNNRFIGAMLLHTISSATIGMFIGFHFFNLKYREYFWTGIGIAAAIAIHAVFNFFMMASGKNYLVVLEGIWIAVIIVLFILERIKRIRLEKINP